MSKSTCRYGCRIVPVTQLWIWLPRASQSHNCRYGCPERPSHPAVDMGKAGKPESDLTLSPRSVLNMPIIFLNKKVGTLIFFFMTLHQNSPCHGYNVWTHQRNISQQAGHLRVVVVVQHLASCCILFEDNGQLYWSVLSYQDRLCYHLIA